MLLPRPPGRALSLLFFLAFGIAAGFAIATDHAWEDYYITYRSSKNLATGNGLVFNVGDRLHTFTSPLGVLLPALASVMTLNSSDTVALWIFRSMSCAAFGGAAVLLALAVRGRSENWIPAVLAAAWLCVDAKSVDFAINGMETGFMLLFLALALWATFSPVSNRRWLYLGIAWGGLMWTRPDSFIYIGLLAASAWLFNPREGSGLGRREWLGVVFKAALLCTVIYLPWFIGAWAYYGSPVPHTIVAKASVSPTPWTLSTIVEAISRFPRLAWEGKTTLEATFLPTYYVTGGWPKAVIVAMRLLGMLTAILWVFPRVCWEARAVSLAFIGAHLYLSIFPYFPFPWYLPPTTLLAVFVWAVLCRQLLAKNAADRRSVFAAAAGVTVSLLAVQLCLQAWLFTAVARQMAAMQRLIEHGNRRQIGEWLAAESKTGDRVFMEPLGYIGFFSGLKTFDWPGLSSREVVEAHARLGSEWSRIIDYLGPDWLVLRPHEIALINGQMPLLLTKTYEKIRDFDVRSRVEELDVRGRRLLEMDALFTVFHRRSQKRFVAEVAGLETRYPGPITKAEIGGEILTLVHAPGSLTVTVPEGATHVRVGYAMAPGAYEGDLLTDGAVFEVVWEEDGRRQVLHFKELDPAARPEDRGLFHFDGPLPDSVGVGAKLVLRALPRGSDTKDWTCWGLAEFR